MSEQRSIIEEGRNCWQIGNARRLAFLVDGAAYFESLVASMDQAKKAIYIVGWDIDSRTNLLRRDNKKKGQVSLNQRINEKVRKTPGLDVYILVWDFSMIYALEREWVPPFRLAWRNHPHIHFQMDDEHPTGAAQHQKFIVMDDAVAFCGGLDITKNRWDTPEHKPDDPRRTDPNGRGYGPFHDIQMIVDHEAAGLLGDLFRERWFWACGETLHPEKSLSQSPWPQNIDPHLRDVRVAVARTLPAYKGRKEVRELEALYRDAIKASREYTYIESQYLTAAAIADALADSLKQAQGPEIVIIVPEKSSGWLERSTMDAIRAQVIHRLRKADSHDRLRIFYPALDTDNAVYVHAKAMVMDDRMVTVGSANLSNRSMGLDSECNLAFEVDGGSRDAEAVAAFRNRLLAEHLGTTSDLVGKTLKENRSLIETIETLSKSGRRLRNLPIEQDVPVDAAAIISDTSLLDPERPAKFDLLVDQFAWEEDKQGRKTYFLKIALVLLALFGMAAAWRWSPLSEWIDIKKIMTLAAELKGHPLLPFVSIAAYIVGGLLMFPVILLIGATAVLFPPLLGAFIAMIGCLLSSLVTYAIGNKLSKQIIRKVAGNRLNRLSKVLAKQGVLTVAIIRNFPVAPFTIVNMVAGASHINMKDFLLGTGLGMAPGIVVVTFFTDRLVTTVKEPNWVNIAVTAGIGILLGIVFWWAKKRISKHKLD